MPTADQHEATKLRPLLLLKAALRTVDGDDINERSPCGRAAPKGRVHAVRLVHEAADRIHSCMASDHGSFSWREQKNKNSATAPGAVPIQRAASAAYASIHAVGCWAAASAAASGGAVPGGPAASLAVVGTW